MSDDVDLGTRAGVDEDASPMSEMADAFDALAREPDLGEDAAVQRFLDRCADQLMAATWASITHLRQGAVTSVATTSGAARLIDSVQHRAGVGPSVDALADDVTVVTPDVARDDRWQPLGRYLHDELGVRSMLAYPLHLLGDEAAAVITFSSDRSEAFSTEDVHRGSVLARHAALLVTAHSASTRAGQLARALDSNREIGVAVGVLMARHALTREQAFEVLRGASQNTNRRLAVIASEVGDTGEVPSTR